MSRASIVLIILLLAGAAASLRAEPAARTVRVTLTALPRTAHDGVPPLTPGDLAVFEDGARRAIVDLVPASDTRAGLDLAILVQDSLDQRIGSQLEAIGAFLRRLPASSRISVAYFYGGTLDLRQDFTSDFSQAAAALRLPRGAAASSIPSNPYVALRKALERFDGSDRRHQVIIISDGIDLLQGAEDARPGNNLDLARAIERAQAQGAVVHAIYAADGINDPSLVSSGQASLARLASQTGGGSYFTGFETAPGFEPYFARLDNVFGRQYVLTYTTEANGKRSRKLRVSTETPGVELVAPDRVVVPAAAQ